MNIKKIMAYRKDVDQEIEVVSIDFYNDKVRFHPDYADYSKFEDVEITSIEFEK